MPTADGDVENNTSLEILDPNPILPTPKPYQNLTQSFKTLNTIKLKARINPKARNDSRNLCPPMETNPRIRFTPYKHPRLTKTQSKA